MEGAVLQDRAARFRYDHTGMHPSCLAQPERVCVTNVRRRLKGKGMRSERGSGADGWGRSDFIHAHKTSSSAACCSSNKRLFITALPLFQRSTQRQSSAPPSELFHLSCKVLSLKLRVRVVVFSTYFCSFLFCEAFKHFFFSFLIALFPHQLVLCRCYNHFPTLAGVGSLFLPTYELTSFTPCVCKSYTFNTAR